jgi:hypothetical protein
MPIVSSEKIGQIPVMSEHVRMTVLNSRTDRRLPSLVKENTKHDSRPFSSSRASSHVVHFLFVSTLFIVTSALYYTSDRMKGKQTCPYFVSGVTFTEPIPQAMILD